jgi:DUF4097 and DUF4098 domain-containing protein YvlB
MGRKIAFLILVLVFGASVETAWQVRNHAPNIGIGPDGCRVMGGKFYGPSFTFDDVSSRPWPEGAAVKIENTFGAVTVGVGAPGEVRVKITKRVFRPTREEADRFAGRIAVVLEEDGGALRIGTNREALSREEPHVGFETSLEIALPAGAKVALENAHGPTEVKDVAELHLETSFDSLIVERVAGPVEITHRHGNVEVAEVGGALTLEARHGAVAVRGVSGFARLDTEHGDVKVEGAAGLRIKHAHGRVEARTIGGDLDVEADHSAVEVEDVTGSARVKTAFNRLQVVGVGGDAVLEVAHGRLVARSVTGALEATARFDGVSLEDIGGPVKVRVEHGGIVARGVRRGLEVEAEGDAVRLSEVSGPVQVRASRGEVTFSPEAPIVDEVTITATHGAIRVDVPANSHFDLDAHARHGEVEVNLPGAPRATSDGPGSRSLQASVGGGGKPVRLRAEAGSISVIGTVASVSN